MHRSAERSSDRGNRHAVEIAKRQRAALVGKQLREYGDRSGIVEFPLPRLVIRSRLTDNER
jgi:hypothetical protein